MGLKEEFLKINSPQRLLEFMRKNKDLHYDADMAKHFNAVAKQHLSNESPENHADPREAFMSRK